MSRALHSFCIFNLPFEGNLLVLTTLFAPLSGVLKRNNRQEAGNAILSCACSDFNALIAQHESLVCCMHGGKMIAHDTRQNAF